VSEIESPAPHPEAAAAPPPGPPPPPAPQPASGWAEFRERLSVERVRAARSEVQRRSQRQIQDLALARAARDLADSTLDAREPLPPGTTVPLAIGLYRDAVFWALSASIPGETAPSPREVLSAAESRTLLEATTTAEARDLVEIVLEETQASWARRPHPEQEKVVRTLGEASRALLERVTAPDRIARWGSSVRIGLTILGAVLFSFLLYQLSLVIRGPDYALGKPWRASSSMFRCKPEANSCGGANTTIFFHTNDQEKPWVEIDLGEPVTFSEVVVHNRSDCCQERASPLMLEAGPDPEHLVQIARREEPFDVWHARFKSQTSRYLRLTVPRRSILHLERIEVRR
jgi:F5/8 type C domain